MEKNMKRYILKMLSVAVAVICLMLPQCFSVSAAEAEVTYTRDSAGYTPGTFMDGLNGVQGSDRGIITLNTDCAITQTMIFAKGDCLIDLNGNQLSVDICGIVIEEGAALRVKDSTVKGKIVLKSADSDCFIFDNKGTLEIQSGKLMFYNTLDNEAIAVKSSGELTIGSADSEAAAELAKTTVDAGSLSLVAAKGIQHKIEGITVADGVDVKLDCAVINETADVTSLVKAGYKESAEISVVDASEKPAAANASEGIYNGHNKSAAEVMNADVEPEEIPTLYTVLVIAAAVVLIAAAIIITAVILKKQKSK